MSENRKTLAHMDGGLVLTDGGLETTLVFHDGIDLPHFAAFPLLDSDTGRAALRRYYEKYLALAREGRLGFILDTPTWRANPDWASLLGYDRAALRRVNIEAVAFVQDLQRRWLPSVTPCVTNGVIGPRGDGYVAGSMDPNEAEDYHAVQIEALAAARVAMVSAMTMNTIGEAVGIARAARSHDLAHVISFTLETELRGPDPGLAGNGPAFGQVVDAGLCRCGRLRGRFGPDLAGGDHGELPGDRAAVSLAGLAPPLPRLFRRRQPVRRGHDRSPGRRDLAVLIPSGRPIRSTAGASRSAAKSVLIGPVRAGPSP